LKLSLQSQL